MADQITFLGWATGTAGQLVQLGNLTTLQTFVVAECLSAPVILGCDFLTVHGMVLDFEKGTCRNKRHLRDTKLSLPPQMSCNLILDDDYPQAVPYPASEEREKQLDMPTEFHPLLGQLLKDHKALFQMQLGKTCIAEHMIDIGHAAPIKVPPHPIPFHFQDRVHQQL